MLLDGQTLEGELISRNAEAVVFAIGGLQLSFPAANVISIERDMTSQALETQLTAPLTLQEENQATLLAW